jgi:hypothetical protein
MPEPIILNWIHLTVVAMLFFAYKGWTNGWQRALIMLASLFFAWAIVTESTTSYLCRIIYAITYIDLSAKVGLFQIFIYLSTVLMVIITFNKLIQLKAENYREKLTGFLTGLVTGYFFVLLLLDIGRIWIEANFNQTSPVLIVNSQIYLLGLSRHTQIAIDFWNNPFSSHAELITVQSWILLFWLAIFWFRRIWLFIAQTDQTLRPS